LDCFEPKVFWESAFSFFLKLAFFSANDHLDRLKFVILERNVGDDSCRRILLRERPGITVILEHMLRRFVRRNMPILGFFILTFDFCLKAFRPRAIVTLSPIHLWRSNYPLETTVQSQPLTSVHLHFSHASLFSGTWNSSRSATQSSPQIMFSSVPKNLQNLFGNANELLDLGVSKTGECLTTLSNTRNMRTKTYWTERWYVGLIKHPLSGGAIQQRSRKYELRYRSSWFLMARELYFDRQIVETDRNVKVSIYTYRPPASFRFPESNGALILWLEGISLQFRHRLSPLHLFPLS